MGGVLYEGCGLGWEDGLFVVWGHSMVAVWRLRVGLGWKAVVWGRSMVAVWRLRVGLGWKAVVWGRSMVAVWRLRVGLGWKVEFPHFIGQQVKPQFYLLMLQE